MAAQCLECGEIVKHDPGCMAMARNTVRHGNPLGVLEQSDLEGKDYEKIRALIGALVDELAAQQNP